MGGVADALVRFLRTVCALGLAVAVGGGVILVVETSGPEPVRVLAGRGPGTVMLLASDDTGPHPFTPPFAVDLALDPLLLPVPPRSSVAVESPHRRHSAADRLVAAELAPALAAAGDPSQLRIAQLRTLVDRTLGVRAVVDHLEDLDGDRHDDDRRFTVTALDGSAACVAVGAPRHLARSLGLPIDVDGTMSSGISWSPFGPCTAARQARPGADVRVGTTPGTYGAKAGGDVCDVTAVRRYLASEPEAAAVWAPLLGQEPAGAMAFVDTLTPVVLLADTAVTHHELRGGRVASQQAVLERGTAVLVDPFGMPVVRCISGSPLRSPQALPDGVVVEGTAWPGFDLDAVRRVPAGVRHVSTFVLIDLDTGVPLRRGAGIDGRLARLAGPVVIPQSG